MIDSKAIGELVEEVVVDAVDGIEPVDAPDEYHDAIATTPISTPDAPTVFVDVDSGDVHDGTPIEIKGAMYRISEGTDQAIGRFYIRQKQHGKLQDAGGVYILAVYRPEQGPTGGFDLELAGLVIASADAVDQRRNGWYDVTGRETYTQVRWTDFPFNGDLASESSYESESDAVRRVE